MGFFDINSPFMRSMAKVADIIILNFLFMLCCIPVITIGPAITALYSVTMKLVRDEEGGIVKEFFSSFRLNLKQGIVIHILFLVIAFVLFVDIWFVLFSVTDHGAMTYILFAVSAFAQNLTILPEKHCRSHCLWRFATYRLPVFLLCLQQFPSLPC